MDVFVTKRLDNTWTKWSEPLNMGPHINTIEFDAYFSVPAKGDYAYLVTSLNTLGAEDIVRITLSESARPEPVVVIHGKIFDAKTKKPLSADITYEELPGGKALGNAISNPTTGEYKIVLPYEKVYGIFAEKAGYLTKNDNIDLTNLHEYQEIEKDFYLVPIEVGEKIVMNNIFFAQGTPNILPNSFPELDRFVDMLKKNPKMEIEVGGHTDNVGEPALNQILSEQRVVAITKYFISKGILAKRMLGKGYGDSQPIASNLKEETRKLNRRVEIKILKK
jgi:outer membrane protein OmpA-like peptidoglycan-associated protein